MKNEEEGKKARRKILEIRNIKGSDGWIVTLYSRKKKQKIEMKSGYDSDGEGCSLAYS